MNDNTDIEEKTRKLLALFAAAGVKDCLLLYPPEGAETKAEITPEGEILATDKKTSEKHKIFLKA